MRSTLVGVFETRQAANRARDELLRAGFMDDEVSVRESAASDPAATSDAPAESGHPSREAGASTRGSIRDTVGDWFRSLLGLDDDDIGTYSEAVRRGNSIVTVSAHSDDRIDRASEVLHECGSIDIDERADAWQLQGWTRPSSPTPASSPAWRAPPSAPLGSTASSAEALGGASGSQDAHAGGKPRTADTRRPPVGKRVVGRRHLRVYTWRDEEGSSETGRGSSEAGSI